MYSVQGLKRKYFHPAALLTNPGTIWVSPSSRLPVPAEFAFSPMRRLAALGIGSQTDAPTSGVARREFLGRIGSARRGKRAWTFQEWALAYEIGLTWEGSPDHVNLENIKTPTACLFLRDAQTRRPTYGLDSPNPSRCSS